MLVLSRKSGESIVIGDDIIVKVVGVKGEKIKIGIKCEDGLSVYREEVYELIRAENELAKNSISSLGGIKISKK